jgi:RNase P/RNase MRP subunit p30
MIDIVIPSKNNETSFINRARKLGYSGVCFLYEENNISDKHIKKLKDKTDFKILVGVVVENNPDKFRKYDLLISKSNNVSVIRKKVNLLLDIEEEKDAMHQRRSGLNHVLCRLMKEKKVGYGINFHTILNSDSRGDVLGRIIQNVKLCNKYKVDILFGSFARNTDEMRAPEDFKSLMRLLGVKSPKCCFLG